MAEQAGISADYAPISQHYWTELLFSAKSAFFLRNLPEKK